MQMVDAETWEVIQYAGLYEKGLPPVHGGVLDQSRRFIELCQIVWREQAHWKRVDG